MIEATALACLRAQEAFRDDCSFLFISHSAKSFEIIGSDAFSQNGKRTFKLLDAINGCFVGIVLIPRRK
ncbi:hypothetical protein MGWOODY_Hyp1295 [hydrothermal vent metagenome]|uniref:Uncharacterized protein n=1 Tax=hydrothermal vent metagenome TaxID=652676 RepID=A0A160TXD1_9ZZZZ